MQNVTVHTRAGRKGQGKEIVCPKCMTQRTVYHFWWSALVCGTCRAEVAKTDWLLHDITVSKNMNMETDKYLLNRDKYYLLSYLAYATISAGPSAYHVMKLRFGLDVGDWCENCHAYQKPPLMTLQAIGDHYGVSHSRIKQVEAKALRCLRNHMPKEVTNSELLSWTKVAPHYMIAIGWLPRGTGWSDIDARVAEHYEQYPNREVWKSMPLRDLIPAEPTFKKREAREAKEGE